MKNRPGFSMIELSYVVIISGLIAMFWLSKMQGQGREEKIRNMSADAQEFIKRGILDMGVGYVNGTGGWCSVNNDFINISAKRVVNCSNLKYPVTDLGDDNDGSKSLARIARNSYGKCDVMVDENDANNIRVFFDCGTFADTPQKRAYIEELLTHDIAQNFKTIYKGVSRSASGITATSNAGNSNDGKVRFLLGLD